MTIHVAHGYMLMSFGAGVIVGAGISSWLGWLAVRQVNKRLPR